MKNTKILISAFLVSILYISSLSSVSADSDSDFDCTSVDRYTVKEIMDKQRNGEYLTDSEQEIIENMKECSPERKSMQKSNINSGDKSEKPELTYEQKEQMEEMKEILEKKKSGEELSDDEKELYDEFMDSKDNKKAVKKISHKAKREVQNLSKKTKTSIWNAMLKVNKVFSKLSDEDKSKKYESIQDKLEEKLETILDNDNLSDTKKELFESIINELLNQLDEKIEELN